MDIFTVNHKPRRGLRITTLVAAGAAVLIVLSIAVWELWRSDSRQSNSTDPTFGKVDGDSADPSDAPDQSDVTIVVEVRAVDTDDVSFARKLNFIVWGKGWQSPASSFNEEGEGRVIVTLPADAVFIGTIVWGSECFTEVQSAVVSRNDRDASTLNLPPVVVRRKCSLTTVVKRKIQTQDSAKPESVEEGNAGPANLEGEVQFLVNAAWLIEPSTIEKAAANQDSTAIANLASKALGQVPVHRQLTFDDWTSTILDLPEGVTVALEVNGDGLATMRASPLVAYPRTSVTLTASTATTLRVMLTTARGSQAAGVSCQIIRLPEPGSVVNPRPEAIRTGYTDVDGEWLVGVPAGKTLRVLANSPEGIAHADVVCVEGANKVSLSLTDGHVLSGQVLDDSNGPVGGLRLQFVSLGGEYRTLVVTDRLGEFSTRFPTYVEGATVLLYGMSSGVSAEEMFTGQSILSLNRMTFDIPTSANQIILTRRPIELLPGVGDLTFFAERGISDRFLRLEGQRLSPHRLIPDAFAVYSVDVPVPATGGMLNMDAGVYQMRALEVSTSDGLIQASPYMEFEIQGEQTTRVSFILEEAVPFSVRLIDSTGQPLSGISVANDGMYSRARVTDNNGRAAFGYHAPGSHTVSILSRGLSAGSLNAKEVTLVADSKTFDIIAEPAPVQISVRSEDTNVQFKLSPVSSYSVREPIIEPDQSYGFRNAVPGTWHIQAWTVDGAFLTGQRIDVESFSQRFQFKYQDGKFVRIN